jgi:Ankyrin repeats (3 copies)
MSDPGRAFLEDVLAGDLPRVRASLIADRSLLAAATDEDFGRSIPPGSTALHLAVRHGHGPIVDALIATGIDLNARNAHGRTPLHDALQYDNRMRGRLLDAGAHVDICHAAFLDLDDRIMTLVEQDPRLVHDQTTGLRPLGWACYGNAARAADTLLRCGATMEHGELVCAAQVAGVDAAQVLLSRGIDVNALHPGSGFNALHAALTTPYVEDATPFVDLLLVHGAGVNVRTARGLLPLDLLHHARVSAGTPARTAALDSCEVLLRARGARRDPA